MKTCRVTIRDMDGIDHTAQVAADTLYEAVARGIVALKESAWTGDLVEGSAQVIVNDTPVEHTIRLREFRNWLAKTAGAPRDISHRQKIREILGAK
jgi:hypothetical protein